MGNPTPSWQKEDNAPLCGAAASASVGDEQKKITEHIRALTTVCGFSNCCDAMWFFCVPAAASELWAVSQRFGVPLTGDGVFRFWLLLCEAVRAELPQKRVQQV